MILETFSHTDPTTSNRSSPSLLFPSAKHGLAICLKFIFGISLNPGPFTIKEHIITIRTKVGDSAAYVMGAEFGVFAVFLMPHVERRHCCLNQLGRHVAGTVQLCVQAWMFSHI
jgi:hypothetical protein